jgi:hypothetical protein
MNSPGLVASDLSSDYSHIYREFYKVERAGAVALSDGGGPFGFDITIAVIFDYLVRAYNCDTIIETGCFLGDTTFYLGRTYPTLRVLSCDSRDDYVRFTTIRTRELRNVTITEADSSSFIAQVAPETGVPIFFLDAHGYDRWPLKDEIAAIKQGLVVIHDFDIEHPRFAYESLGKDRCDDALLRNTTFPAHYFVVSIR